MLYWFTVGWDCFQDLCLCALHSVWGIISTETNEWKSKGEKNPLANIEDSSAYLLLLLPSLPASAPPLSLSLSLPPSFPSPLSPFPCTKERRYEHTVRRWIHTGQAERLQTETYLADTTVSRTVRIKFLLLSHWVFGYFVLAAWAD